MKDLCDLDKAINELKALNEEEKTEQVKNIDVKSSYVSAGYTQNPGRSSSR